MEFPEGYPLGLTEEYRRKVFPLLLEGNFSITSLRSDIRQFVTPNYNCCAWALHRKDKWLQHSKGFLEEISLDIDKIDDSVNTYIHIYSFYGFEVCANGVLEDNFEKIVLYEKNGQRFSHVARQLKNGKWTSKLGGLEDIEHLTPYTLNGVVYGQPKVFMKRVL